MSDTGYAVFVDNSVTGQPVAIFAYASHARDWAVEMFPGRHHVRPLDWHGETRTDVDPPPVDPPADDPWGPDQPIGGG